MFIFFNKQIKKFSSDYWGGKKGVLPHPNYWGARARAAPRVYAYAGVGRLLCVLLFPLPSILHVAHCVWDWYSYYNKTIQDFVQQSSLHGRKLGAEFGGHGPSFRMTFF